MDDMQYDVAVAYRIYPRVSKPTPVFSADKYRLAELCLHSFREAIGGLRIKVWALLDGCPPEYAELFRRYFPAEDLEMVALEGEGNERTFERQIDLLLQQSSAELVYFAEDDYFYFPGALEEMVGFLTENPDAEFVSPYDHPDYYALDLHRHDEEVRVVRGRHWRTAGTTCLTFLTRRRTLARTRGVFRSYVSGRCSDAGLWLSLTKRGLFQPGRMVGLLRTDRRQARVLFHAWRHCARQVLFGRTRKLWVPIPSVATHTEAAFLAPGNDWRAVMTREAARLQVDGRVPSNA